MVEPIHTTPSRLKITAKLWQQMIACGVLGKDDRLELLEGDVYIMTPIGPLHNWLVMKLTQLLPRMLGDELMLNVQGPVSLDELSEPQPDLTVVRAADATLKHHARHPLLAIEVSDSSLDFDRTLKQRIYARARIPEYWIVNAVEQVVEVYRRPDRKAGSYRDELVFTRTQTLRSTSVPEVVLKVEALFR